MTGYCLYRADGTLSAWVTDLYLSSAGWPWGMGADALCDAADGWLCDDCGKPANRLGKAIYGTTERCVPCSLRWTETTFTVIPIRPAPWAQHDAPVGQQTLELVA